MGSPEAETFADLVESGSVNTQRPAMASAGRDAKGARRGVWSIAR